MKILVISSQLLSTEELKKVPNEHPLRIALADPSYGSIRASTTRTVEAWPYTMDLLKGATHIMAFLKGTDPRVMEIIVRANKLDIPVDVYYQYDEPEQQELIPTEQPLSWAEAQEAAFDAALEKLRASPYPEGYSPV